MSKLIPLTIIAIFTVSSVLFNDLYNPKSIAITLFLSIIAATYTIIHKKNKYGLIETLIAVFAILSTVSLIFSPIKTLGWDEITLELSILAIALTVANYKAIKPTQIGYLTGFLIVIQSLFAWHQTIFREETRAAGTFMNFSQKSQYFPNALGLFCVSTLPLTLLIKNKWLKYSIFALGTSTLLASFSRGALLVFLLQLAAIGLFELIQSNKKQLIYLILASIIGVGLFISGQQIRNITGLTSTEVSQKYNFEGTEKLTSVNERAQFMEATTKAVINNPLKFYGPNSFPFAYPQFQPMFLANAPHPHNIFLKFAFERGIWTALIFALVILLLIANFIRQKKYSDFTSVILIVTLLGIIFHNSIDFNLNFAINYILFGIILGMSIEQCKPKFNSKINPLIVILILNLAIGGIWLYKQTNQTLANIALSKNKTEAAINYLERVNLNQSNLTLTDLYIQKNDFQKAKETAEREAILNPLNAFNLNKLGGITKNPDQTFEIYKQAITNDPQNFWIYYLNAIQTAEKTGDFKYIQNQKDNIFKKLSLYSDYAEANLHYTAQTGNINNAIQLSKTLQKYDPRQIKITKSLQSSKERFSGN